MNLFINQDKVQRLLNSGVMQNGIYYLSSEQPGASFAILFFRVKEGVKARDIQADLNRLWDVWNNLAKGIVNGLEVHPTLRKSNNLSVLLGFGPEIFNVQGVKKTPPKLFKTAFLSPRSEGGGSIINGSNFTYSKDTTENHAVSDQIAVQFIADNEFGTSRAIVETWKYLMLPRT